MQNNTTSHSVLLGIIYMTAFGMLWLANPLFSGNSFNLVASLVIITLYLVAIIPRLLRLVRRRTSLASLDPAVNSKFSIIGLTETVGIIAVIVLCGRLHQPHAIPAAVAVIVGLHFFPLSRLFKMRLYNYTGGVILLAGIIGLLFLRQLFASDIFSYFVPYSTAITLFVTSWAVAANSQKSAVSV